VLRYGNSEESGWARARCGDGTRSAPAEARGVALPGSGKPARRHGTTGASALGLERDALEEVCREASELGLVVVANDNSPGQLVISGEEQALQRAMELAQRRGAKRVVRLGVTVASHSPLMERVAHALAEMLARIPLREPEIPIVANVTGRILSTVEEIRRELACQVAQPVQWTTSVREMTNRGVTTFLEVGPGQVLTGLVKKIQRDVEAYSMRDLGLES
jgi:[acyl-carrier-protein] S-malonyltransferase